MIHLVTTTSQETNNRSDIEAVFIGCNLRLEYNRVRYLIPTRALGVHTLDTTSRQIRCTEDRSLNIISRIMTTRTLGTRLTLINSTIRQFNARSLTILSRRIGLTANTTVQTSRFVLLRSALLPFSTARCSMLV